MELDAPMAVRAVWPANLPAMMVSASVYSCWNTAPPNSGSVYLSNTFQGVPTVRSAFMDFLCM